jgi:uncharacterized protein (TIGR02118 family)
MAPCQAIGLERSEQMIKFVALIKRKEGLTRQEFRDHYENVHAPLAMECYGFSHYVRNYVVTVEGAPDSGFDVVTEFAFADRAASDKAAAFDSSPTAKIVREDEARFIAINQSFVFPVDVRGMEMMHMKGQHGN